MSVSYLSRMSDLEMHDEKAAGWFANNRPNRIESFGVSNPSQRDCRPRLHLLGDSIVHKAGITSRFEDDEVFDRAVGGET